MSKITREIATAALIVFAGQTVTRTEVGEYIEQQYWLLSGGRKQTFGSFTATLQAIEDGVEYMPSFSGDRDAFFIFPTI